MVTALPACGLSHWFLNGVSRRAEVSDVEEAQSVIVCFLVLAPQVRKLCLL